MPAGFHTSFPEKGKLYGETKILANR